MAKPRKRVNREQADKSPKYVVSNCSFTIDDPSGQALVELAKAARATAEAILAIAGRAAVGNEICALKIVGAEGIGIESTSVKSNGSLPH